MAKKGIAGVVGRRCVSFGGRWGCENRGVQVSDYSICMSRRWRGGGVVVCVVEGVGLVAAAVGWRMSSWLQVCCLCWPVYWIIVDRAGVEIHWM